MKKQYLCAINFDYGFYTQYKGWDYFHSPAQSARMRSIVKEITCPDCHQKLTKQIISTGTLPDDRERHEVYSCVCVGYRLYFKGLEKPWGRLEPLL